MSLQLLAKQMEAKGRKGDSVLVHMTPSEVAALQEMAESAGGSLSVNPETGLVEAFSLRNLLPAIVGGALMVSGVGMPLAIAGGALTGGVQAKRNDQDFLSGALMGGLSAYGGAGLAGGLGAAGNVAASQAASAANPAFMGPMPGAATGFEAAKAGLAGLGKQAGREAFMQGVGGMGGLAKAAGAVAAPMMMPQEQKMAEAPVDDEMYSYTFDPGRTGAEGTPTNSTAERRFFRNEFSPMRRIPASEYPVYAAQGGLMQLAEGGETTAPADVAAPTASEAALAYLMGERSSSAAGMPAASPPPISEQPMPAPPTMAPDQMFSFSPTTGTFTRNPNYVDPTIKPVTASSPPVVIGGGGGGGGGGGFFGGNPSRPGNNFSVPGDDDYMGYDPGGDYSLPGNDDYMGYESVSQPGNDDYMGYDSGGGVGAAQGGLLGLAKGGMASGGFVVPADVVSALGNGSTDAGLRKLYAMTGSVKPIKGKGDGLSDSIPTDIDGKQAARVADGEAYIDPKTVKRLGGAKKLYAMMDKVRAQAHGKTTQQRKVNPGRVMA